MLFLMRVLIFECAHLYVFEFMKMILASFYIFCLLIIK